MVRDILNETFVQIFVKIYLKMIEIALIQIHEDEYFPKVLTGYSTSSTDNSTIRLHDSH